MTKKLSLNSVGTSSDYNRRMSITSKCSLSSRYSWLSTQSVTEDNTAEQVIMFGNIEKFCSALFVCFFTVPRGTTSRTRTSFVLLRLSPPLSSQLDIEPFVPFPSVG